MISFRHDTRDVAHGGVASVGATGRIRVGLAVSVLLLAAGSTLAQEKAPDPPPKAQRGSLAGPDQVDNLLQQDALPVEPLIEFVFLKPYFDFKARVREKTGLSFSIDYTTVVLGATQSLGEASAGSGMVRFYGSWGLVGRDGASNTGAFIYKIENRHAYTNLAPFDFGFEIGYAGLFEPPFSDQRWRATNIYWRQTFADSRFVVLGGFLDTTDYVDVYGLASPWLHFMNFAFSTGSASIATPGDATFGVAGGAWLSDNVFVIASLADANADPTKPFDGLDSFFSQQEYFKNVDIGWTSSRERAYFDNIHLTYWHADERVEAGVPSGWGVAGSFTLFPGDKWMPFVRGGYSKDGGSLLQKSLSAGFAFQPHPEFDLFGFGFNWGEPNETTFQPGLRDQFSAEAFYRFRLAENLALTPDLQWILHPALNPDVDSLWVFGIRARLSL